jgi:hypothetical protein
MYAGSASNYMLQQRPWSDATEAARELLVFLLVLAVGRRPSEGRKAGARFLGATPHRTTPRHTDQWL